MGRLIYIVLRQKLPNLGKVESKKVTVNHFVKNAVFSNFFEIWPKIDRSTCAHKSNLLEDLLECNDAALGKNWRLGT